jgi:hypothetical protein
MWTGGHYPYDTDMEVARVDSQAPERVIQLANRERKKGNCISNHRHKHPNTQAGAPARNPSHRSCPPGCNRCFPLSPGCHQEEAHTQFNCQSLLTPIVVRQQTQQDSVQGLIIHQLTISDSIQLAVQQILFFESRILTCLTYTSRRGSQHRGQTAEQEDTKARKAKLQRPRTAAARQPEPQTAGTTS